MSELNLITKTAHDKFKSFMGSRIIRPSNKKGSFIVKIKNRMPMLRNMRVKINRMKPHSLMIMTCNNL